MDLLTVLKFLQLTAVAVPEIAEAVTKITTAFHENDPAVLAQLLAQANAEADAQHQAAQAQ